MEFSERIQLGKALSGLSKDPSRGNDEIHHLIEFKNALEDLIKDELQYSKLQKIIEYYARRRERKLISI